MNIKKQIQFIKGWRIFFLGFSSGLPFLLILATLGVWLAETGVSKTAIGLFAWVSIPYTLKFLWAPLIDRYAIPGVCHYLGQRRGWMLFSQLLLMGAIIGLGCTKPEEQLWATAMLALLVGIASSLQDIVVEAYRIESVPAKFLGMAASASVLGYRMGMLCSGAGAIYLAAYFQSWKIAYGMMAVCVIPGIVATLLSKEPSQDNLSDLALPGLLAPTASNKTLTRLLPVACLAFFKKQEWWIIIPFIFLYKIADTGLTSMSMQFLLEIGFNKVEIAFVAKTFGISAMILGGVIGGTLLYWYSLQQVLLNCIILQLVSSILFVLQAQLGHDVQFLFITMGVENFTCGMSQVVLIAYLSKLCLQPHTSMHYAMLSSFASLVRVNLSSLSGWLADQTTWPEFYMLVGLSCVPCCILLLLGTKHFIRISQESYIGKKELAPS